MNCSGADADADALASPVFDVGASLPVAETEEDAAVTGVEVAAGVVVVVLLLLLPDWVGRVRVTP